MGDIEGTGRLLRALNPLLQTSTLLVLAAWLLFQGGEGLGAGSGAPPWLPVALAALLVSAVLNGAWLMRNGLRRETDPPAEDTSRDAGPSSVRRSRRFAVGAAGAVVVISAVGWLWLSSAVPMTLAAFALLTGLLFDAFRRKGRFPSVTYGGEPVPQTDLRRAWIAFLLFAFVLSGEGFASTTMQGGESWQNRTSTTYLPVGAQSWSQTQSLFFYRREIREEIDANGLHAGSRTEEVEIPWFFFGAALTYGFLVLGWDREGNPRAS